MREISVVYEDGMMDMVKSNRLQRLIEKETIVKFQRSDGWVYPEIDPVRIVENVVYQGVERRFA